jgi:sialic acid synthase SpsE
MVRPLEMSDELHHRLVERAARQGIEFMSTPFDEEATDLLIGLGMRRVKVPSGEIVNHPFLRYLTAQDLPMIVSTGMADMAEIEEAIEVIAGERGRLCFTAPMSDMVTVLHCTSNYPAACEDVNLRAMRTIAERTGLPIGYSDHTLGLAVSTAAVALGATIIEKHFTMDRALPGPDHRASLEPSELAALVRQIRDVEAALGSSVKAPTASELPVRDLVRRSVTARRDLRAGQVLEPADLILLRPGTGITAKAYDDVLGRRLEVDVAEGQPLRWEQLVQ